MDLALSPRYASYLAVKVSYLKILVVISYQSMCGVTCAGLDPGARP